VQRRLEEIGLSPFCLELHSNKAKKSAVLSQLQKVSDVSRAKSSEEYAFIAQKTAALKDEMGAFTSALHRKHPSGFSLYDCIAGYETLPKESPEMKGEFGDVDRDTLHEMESALSEYIAACSVAGDPSTHPLKGVGLLEYTPGDYAGMLDRLVVASKDLLDDPVFGGEVTGLKMKGSPATTPEKVKAFGELAKALASGKNLDCRILAYDSVTRKTARRNLPRLKEYSASIQDLLKVSTEKVLESEPGALSATLGASYDKVKSKGKIGRLFSMRSLRSEFSGYVKDDIKPSLEKIGSVADALRRYAAASQNIENADGFPPSFGREYFARKGSYEAFESSFEATDRVFSLLWNTCDSTSGLYSARDTLLRSIGGDVDLFLEKGAPALRAFSKKADAFIEAEGKVRAALEPDMSYFENGTNDKASTDTSMPADPSSLDCVERACVLSRRWRQGISSLRDWTLYNRSRRNLFEKGFPVPCSYVKTEK